VKPARDQQKRDVYRRKWWQFAEKQSSLYRAIRDFPRVLANSEVSPHLSFAFLPSNWIYGHTLYVFALPTNAAFGTLQSRAHEVWARFFASSMKDDLRYTPSDCFETFPFPKDFESHPTLEAAGKEYYELRADLMVRNNEGLTKTYNRFHDPNETSPEIVKLRELHAAMDSAVLAAYGGDLAQLVIPPCEFLLDYEDDDDEDDSAADRPGARRRKKPWRYRWPDEFRDEVLARLLELNKRRAEEEAAAGAAERPRRGRRRRSTGATDTGNDEGMF
jgi:restriction-modification enzyme MmeI-like protein